MREWVLVGVGIEVLVGDGVAVEEGVIPKVVGEEYTHLSVSEAKQALTLKL